MAKSQKTKAGIKKQSLVEHILDLIDVFNEISSKNNLDFIEPDFKTNLKYLCFLHDLGKINYPFQQKILLANKIDEFDKFNLDSGDIEKLKKEYSGINDERHNLLSGAMLKYFFDLLNIGEEKRIVLYKPIMLHHGSYEKYMNKSSALIEKAVFDDIENSVLNAKIYDLREVEDFLSRELQIALDFKSPEFLDYGFMKYLCEDFQELDETKYNQKKKLYILYKGFLNLIDHLASSQEKNILYYLPFTESQIDENIKKSLIGTLKFRALSPSLNENVHLDVWMQTP